MAEVATTPPLSSARPPASFAVRCRSLRVVLPFAVIAYLAGTFWTPQQRYPQRRTRLFQYAASVLRRTGESVFLTPEGQACWVFNKGAFHLATSLEVPLAPILIAIA